MPYATLPTRAVWTLTFADAMTEDETVVIGDVTYTFRATIGATANQVDVGTDQTVSAVNLMAAINLGDTAGTNYGSETVLNPYVTASIVTNAQVICTVKDRGVMGAGLTFTEGGDGSWAETTTGSGYNETFLSEILEFSQIPAAVIDDIRAYTTVVE